MSQSDLEHAWEMLKEELGKIDAPSEALETAVRHMNDAVLARSVDFLPIEDD